jgi:hypothetical protein
MFECEILDGFQGRHRSLERRRGNKRATAFSAQTVGSGLCRPDENMLPACSQKLDARCNIDTEFLVRDHA